MCHDRILTFRILIEIPDIETSTNHNIGMLQLYMAAILTGNIEKRV